MVNLNRDDSYLPVGQFDMITELSRLRRAAQDGAVPAEFLAMVQRFTDEQIASKLANRSIKVGDAAPRFALPNAIGKHVSLDRLLASGPAVVSLGATGISVVKPWGKTPRGRAIQQAGQRRPHSNPSPAGNRPQPRPYRGPAPTRNATKTASKN